MLKLICRDIHSHTYHKAIKYLIFCFKKENDYVVLVSGNIIKSNVANSEDCKHL